LAGFNPFLYTILVVFFLAMKAAVIHLHKELGYFERTRFWTDIETFQALSKPAQQLIYGIKIFVDGVLGSETAALNTPYLTTDKQGVLVYSDKELYRLICEVALFNKALAFHAIGDRATAQIISVLTQINHEYGKIPLIRIEHSQFISQNDAKTAKQLGIILSMQPNFSFDSIQYQDRLSIEYCRKNNPFRMLIDEIGFVPGKNLLFGSDGMPHGVPNALESALFPPFPEQALTLDEFVAGYCMPDKKHGYIEVIIDEKKQTVSTIVKV
jgi:predicted amidohydrolase YtcJ